jgi:hypothetical protein
MQQPERDPSATGWLLLRLCVWPKRNKHRHTHTHKSLFQIIIIMRALGYGV